MDMGKGTFQVSLQSPMKGLEHKGTPLELDSVFSGELMQRVEPWGNCVHASLHCYADGVLYRRDLKDGELRAWRAGSDKSAHD